MCWEPYAYSVLRFANEHSCQRFDGRFEIAFLADARSKHRSHCHIAIADEEAKTYGVTC